MHNVRFLAYSRNTAVGVLPHVASWEWMSVLNDTPILKLTVGGPEVDLLNLASDQLTHDIAIEFYYNNAWREPWGGRFVIQEDTLDLTAVEGGALVEISCLGVDNDLDYVFPADSQKNLKSGKITYKNVNAGYILGRVSAEHLEIGGTNQVITRDFGENFDSTQSPWTKATVSVDWALDVSGRALLGGLSDRGLCDWRFEKNMFRAFNPGKGNTLRDGGGGNAVAVQLLLGRDITNADQTRDHRNALSQVRVIGEDGYVVDVPFNIAQYERGLRTVAVQGGGVTNFDEAYEVAKAFYDQNVGASSTELTRTLSLNGKFLPLEHYQVGDTLLAPDEKGRLASLRVQSLTLSGTSNDVDTGNLVFGRLAAASPVTSQVRSLLGGSSVPTVGRVAAPLVNAVRGFINQLVSSEVTNKSATVDTGSQELTLTGVAPAHGQASLTLTADDAGGRVYSQEAFNRTYSSAPNLVITSAGTFGRSTSASKYKVNITEADYGEAVLDLPVKTWYDKSACETWAARLTASGGDTELALEVPGDVPAIRVMPGLIAEDVEAAGLGDFVSYNDQTGEIEGLQYDRLFVTLIPIVRNQRDRIEARDRVIEQLLERVAALEEATP